MNVSDVSVVKYIYNSNGIMELYRAAMGVGFWPDFPDHQIGDFYWYLEKAQIEKIEEIERTIVENKDVLSRYIAQIYAGRISPWRINPEFLCALVLIVKCPKNFTVGDLIENNWSEDIATVVVSAADKFSSSII